ncbi:DUF1508 domain-containing protein [Moraxellaceae bacterium AER2_44_116]|nr:DUF1508 domain-containing protein [Moraxellaceae bacterium]TQC97399.1 DUF1508 domain-containing protein [Moraxellaceae bacterium AER2_44_116]
MHFEIYQDVNLQWRWTLFASNGYKVANAGEGYLNKQDCHHGINLVQRAFNAPIREKMNTLASLMAFNLKPR